MHLNPQIICKKPFRKQHRLLQTRESNKSGGVLPTTLSSACPALLCCAAGPHVLFQAVFASHFPTPRCLCSPCISPPCSLRCAVSASSIYSAVHARSQGPGMERRCRCLRPYLHFPEECCGHFLTYSLCISKTPLRGVQATDEQICPNS